MTTTDHDSQTAAPAPTWGSVLAEHETWGGVIAANPTYADVIDDAGDDDTED